MGGRYCIAHCTLVYYINFRDDNYVQNTGETGCGVGGAGFETACTEVPNHPGVDREQLEWKEGA